MKILLLILVTGFTSGLLAQPVGSNNVEIVWSKTNDWPSSLWVYKAVPQVFPQPVISNLLAMASFTMAENQGTNALYKYDWNDLNFESPDKKRRLWICPTYGYIEYTDPTAKGEQLKTNTAVPTDEEAYPLALDYLRKFGVDRSQLGTRPSTNPVYGPNDLGIRRVEGSHGWTDPKTHENIVDTNSRGIFFVRQVDGVQIDGITHGGVTIVFGEHAKITELKITWRGLEPFQLFPTLTPAQIIEEIRLGHAKWMPYRPDFKATKRMTLTGFTPFYRGQPGDTALEEQQRFFEPYVMVYASLDGTTNATLYGELPIIRRDK